MGSKSKNYFPKIEGEIQCIRSPFKEDYLKKKLKISSKEDSLIELSRGQTLKSFF